MQFIINTNTDERKNKYATKRNKKIVRTRN